MGTPNLKRAQDWLVNMYKSWGIDAKEEQYGTWRGWIRGPSHIDLGRAAGTLARRPDGRLLVRHQRQGGDDGRDHPAAIQGQHRIRAVAAAGARQAGDDFGPDAHLSLAGPVQRDRDAGGSRARWPRRCVAAKAEWSGRGADGKFEGVRGTGYSAALGGGELGVRLEQGGAGGIITSRPKLAYTDPKREGAAERRRGGGAVRWSGGAQPRADDAQSRHRHGDHRQRRVSRGDRSGSRGRGSRGSEGGVGAMEVFETYNTKTPAIALGCEDYGLVYRLADEGDAPKIRLDLDGQVARRAAGVQRRSDGEGFGKAR